MPKAKIKGPVPSAFQDRDRFLVLRYHGRLPVCGARVKEVLHVLWIERAFNDLYDH
jgi:hypothetical protein